MPRLTGPAAYHDRLERERVAALEARIAEFESRLKDWTSPFAAAAEKRAAVKQAYDMGHKDGYRQGWSDKLLGVVPHLYDK